MTHTGTSGVEPRLAGRKYVILTTEPRLSLVIMLPVVQLIAFSLLVGWATRRAFGLYKVGCWFGGGGDLTGALHFSYSSSCHYHLRHS